jgi:phosphoglycolate phosphatase-like HAD superfamily hydrolase
MAITDLQLLIFDLDGVVTSEQKYWNTARLTVWELISRSPYLGLTNYFGADLTTPEQVLAHADRIIDTGFITELKNRAVNSNWDLTFFVFSLHLIGILQQIAIPPISDLPIAAQLATIGQAVAVQPPDSLAQRSQQIIQQFWAATTDLKGSAVQEYVEIFATQLLGQSITGGASEAIAIFNSDLWSLCYQNFQDWYEAKKGYQLPDDETVLDVQQIDRVLQSLANNYTLGIATGRPRAETIIPLTSLGLLPYFDAQRVVTYDDVLEAEASLSAPIKLGKPHPFIVLQAIYPHCTPAEILAKIGESHPAVAYIGDAASDVVAAQAAGCRSIGVLTGFGQDLDYKQRLLASMGCQHILPSILDLPDFLLT